MPESELEELAKRLIALCKVNLHTKAYVAFPADRMQMDLGKEIVVQVAGNIHLHQVENLFGWVSSMFADFFPEANIAVQEIKARTRKEFQ